MSPAAPACLMTETDNDSAIGSDNDDSDYDALQVWTS